MMQNLDLFNKRLDYLYKNYYLKEIPNPSHKSKERFPEELGNIIIGTWIYRDKILADFAKKGNEKVLKVIGNTKKQVLFKRRLKFVYNNYCKKGIKCPLTSDDDKFPKELGEILIGHWLHDHYSKIQRFALKDNKWVLQILSSFREKRIVQTNFIDINLFRKRLKYVHDNYFEKGLVNPAVGTEDAFPKELKVAKIGGWLANYKTLIAKLANEGDEVALDILGNFASMKVKKDLTYERLTYVYENYYKKDKFNPTTYDVDRFPEKLGGILIGNWLHMERKLIEFLKNDGDEIAKGVFINMKLNALKIKQASEIIDYILKNKCIPANEDLFISGGLMKAFLERNKKWIYDNQIIEVLELLVRLIKQINPYYFEEFEIQEEQQKVLRR